MRLNSLRDQNKPGALMSDIPFCDDKAILQRGCAIALYRVN